MTTYDLKKLIDLFLDDELPLELSLEFKEAMFADAELRAEVAEARRAQKALAESFAEDRMTEQEYSRVFSRVTVEAAALDLHRAAQLDLPLNGQFQLPITPNAT